MFSYTHLFFTLTERHNLHTNKAPSYTHQQSDYRILCSNTIFTPTKRLLTHANRVIIKYCHNLYANRASSYTNTHVFLHTSLLRANRTYSNTTKRLLTHANRAIIKYYHNLYANRAPSYTLTPTERLSLTQSSRQQSVFLITPTERL